jgi:hypothetical protein
VFDRALDLKGAKESILLFGPDSNTTSGPDNGLWLNSTDGTSPFFLNSPEFSGFAACEFESYLVNNLAELAVEENQEIYSKSVADRFSVLVIIPKNPLKINTNYNLFICGQSLSALDNVPESMQAFVQDKCISERTIYDAYRLENNVEIADSRISSYGSYIQKDNEATSKVNIKIVTAGTGSEAKYKWWFDDEVEPQPAAANYSERINRCVHRWRILDRGVLVRFLTGEFADAETFYINTVAPDLLEDSYLINFSTGTGAVFEYPEYTSTSAIAPDGLLLPDVDSNLPPAETFLNLISSDPFDGEVNVDLNLNKIVLTFNNEIDVATATQDNIVITSHAVSGAFDGPSGTRSNRAQKVYKIISVSDKQITLEL